MGERNERHQRAVTAAAERLRIYTDLTLADAELRVAVEDVVTAYQEALATPGVK